MAIFVCSSVLMFMASPAALGYIKMVELHDYVQFFLVAILFFVLWFYINIILDFGDFNIKQAPIQLLKKSYIHIKARGIAHLGWLEVVWTIIPIFILTAIAIPSFKLLYALDVVNSPLLTLRCIGNQWYWTYECDIIKPEVGENIQFYLDQKFFIRSQYFDDLGTRYMSSLTDAEFIPSILTFADIDFVDDAEDVFAVLNLTDDEAYLLSLEPEPKLDTYTWFEYEWLWDWRRANVSCFMTDGPYFVDPDLRHSNMRPYPNIIGDSEFYMFKTDSHPRVLTLDSDYNLNVEFSADSLAESIILDFITLTHKVTTLADSFAIDSYMLDVDELQLGAFRLLEVDNYPVLPANAEIRLAVTGTDVIHSYAVPSLGVKIDAIPGRLNQFGIRVRSPGTYYGQCSELCGVGHGFMPIKIQFIKALL